MDFETLYTLCNKHQWFTSGDCRQYDKLFRHAKNGAPLNELAAIIWVCSAEQFGFPEILNALKEAKNQ